MIHRGPYGIYETKDGWLALSMSPLPALQAALQIPEPAPLATERFNHAAREDVARIIEPVMRTRTADEWVEFLVPKGIWAAAVRDHDALFRDPAVQEANVTEEIEHPEAGRVRLLRLPLEFSSCRATAQRMPPSSGQHTRKILRELGYTDAEMDALADQKIVAQSSEGARMGIRRTRIEDARMPEPAG